MIINVTDIQVVKWTVYVEYQCVVADYKMVTDTGGVFKYAQAVWWVTVPAEPQNYPEIPSDPSTWYQLPAEYVAVLTDLTEDIRSALLPMIG